MTLLIMGSFVVIHHPQQQHTKKEAPKVAGRKLIKLSSRSRCLIKSICVGENRTRQRINPHTQGSWREYR